MLIKKGTQVKVISGKDKGKTGEILEINRSLNKVKINSTYISWLWFLSHNFQLLNIQR